jgi:Domain of unknown function (DUF4399)
MSSMTKFRTRFSRAVLVSVIGLAGATLVGCAVTPQAPTKSVFFVQPADGATVGTTFKVVFGVTGMGVRPALEDIEDTKSGHHHILINLDPIKAGDGVPFSDQHIHFGKGQTEAELKLAPGRYKLTMQFANGAHVSYGPALAKTITVDVK